MENERKAAANRKNALKSTGPRSSAGKTRASLNSMKHGLTAARPVILDGECEGEFEAIRTGFHQSWSPIGDAEVYLVERMVQLGWRIRRAEKVEAELFSRQILSDDATRLETALYPVFKIPGVVASEFSSGLEAQDEVDSKKQLAEKRLRMAAFRLGTSFLGLTSAEDTLGKLQRYETALERSFFRAAHELERLQRRRIGEDVAAPEVTDVEISFDPTAVLDSIQPPVVRPAGDQMTPQGGTRSDRTDSVNPVLSVDERAIEVQPTVPPIVLPTT